MTQIIFFVSPFLDSAIDDKVGGSGYTPFSTHPFRHIIATSRAFVHHFCHITTSRAGAWQPMTSRQPRACSVTLVTQRMPAETSRCTEGNLTPYLYPIISYHPTPSCLLIPPTLHPNQPCPSSTLTCPPHTPPHPIPHLTNPLTAAAHPSANWHRVQKLWLSFRWVSRVGSMYV